MCTYNVPLAPPMFWEWVYGPSAMAYHKYCYYYYAATRWFGYYFAIVMFNVISLGQSNVDGKIPTNETLPYIIFFQL